MKESFVTDLQGRCQPVTEGEGGTVPELIQCTEEPISKHCQGRVVHEFVGWALSFAGAEGGGLGGQV